MLARGRSHRVFVSSHSIRHDTLKGTLTYTVAHAYTTIEQMYSYVDYNSSSFRTYTLSVPDMVYEDFVSVVQIRLMSALLSSMGSPRFWHSILQGTFFLR